MFELTKNKLRELKILLDKETNNSIDEVILIIDTCLEGDLEELINVIEIDTHPIDFTIASEIYKKLDFKGR